MKMKIFISKPRLKMLGIFTFMWVKMAATHFVTQFTHVSRHFGDYSRKQKLLFRENCFEIAYVSTIRLLEKRCKIQDKVKIKKTMKAFTIFGRFKGTKLVPFVDL